ncbi:MAG: hypothetical protein KDE58_23850, partial [Caldilineaceae bacterium]|nr:hypothetical protein [Caldilineaceae bacterium]
LFALRRLTFKSEDNTPQLVRALAGNPLTIFYETEKLLETRLRGQEQTGGLLTWLMQQAHHHVLALAQNQGGFMEKLSHHLERLAQIAWQDRLIGRSLEKSSLLFALSEVFEKLSYDGGAVDIESLKAAATQDIFDHLVRIATDDRFKPGRKKREAAEAFVTGWFDDVLNGVYGGNRRKLLTDEKLIRSAFHFYIRQQIPTKDNNGDKPGDDTIDNVDEATTDLLMGNEQATA